MVQHGAVPADGESALLAEEGHGLLRVLAAALHLGRAQLVECLPHVRDVEVGLQAWGRQR